MAVSAYDPDLIHYWPMNERGATATRANKVTANATYVMYPLSNLYTDNIVPSVLDNRNKYAAQCTPTVTGYATVDRGFGPSASKEGTFAQNVANGYFPAFPAVGEGVSMGGRFQMTSAAVWITSVEYHMLNFTDSPPLGDISSMTIFYANTGPGWRPAIALGDETYQMDFDSTDGNITLYAGAYTGIAQYPIVAEDDSWWSMYISLQRTATSVLRIWGFLGNEETGEYMICHKDVACGTDWPKINEASTTYHWRVGWRSNLDGSFSGTLRNGISDLWVLDRHLGPDEMYGTFTAGGVSVPWDPEGVSYEVLDNKVRVAVANERTDFPPTRPLPTGMTSAHYPAGSYGTRPRLRFEGFEPGRPWALNHVEMRFDTAGPMKSKTNNRFVWDNFDKGLVRKAGKKPVGSMTDVRNMEFSGLGARRRRGFKVEHDANPAQLGRTSNGFFSWRATNTELFRIAKINDTLYYDDGDLNASSTGWGGGYLPSFVAFRDRAAVLTPLKRSIVWSNPLQETAFDGEAAPTGGSVAVFGAGTLAGTFYYAYTFYDPTSGDETGPKLVGSAAPATEGVKLSSLDTSPTHARFTHQRIYRTVAGGAAPDFYLTASQALNTSYTDTGDANGTIEIRHIQGTYTTLIPPENFTMACAHAGRVFYAGGVNKDRVYRSEANTLNSFQADAYTSHSGAVRGLASRGAQLIVFTDHTTEIVESDWVRDANGATFEQIPVISTVVGTRGHGCVVDADDKVFWIDTHGAYRLNGDVVEPISGLMDNVFRQVNWQEAHKFKAGWNPIRGQVWWTVATNSFQDDNTELNTQLVYQMESGQWTMHDLNASWVGQYDGGDSGVQFGCMDEYGMWKRLETYESDGSASVTAATEIGTMTAVSGNTVTDSGKSWTVNAYRGYGLILRDKTDGAWKAYTIIANTATVLTLDRPVFSALATGDEYYIGGIGAFMELSEQMMGSVNRKISRQLHIEMDDLTRGDNI